MISRTFRSPFRSERCGLLKQTPVQLPATAESASWTGVGTHVPGNRLASPAIFGPAIYDERGRVLALASDNPPRPPVPVKSCEHGVLCKDCR